MIYKRMITTVAAWAALRRVNTAYQSHVLALAAEVNNGHLDICTDPLARAQSRMHRRTHALVVGLEQFQNSTHDIFG